MTTKNMNMDIMDYRLSFTVTKHAIDRYNSRCKLDKSINEILISKHTECFIDLTGYLVYKYKDTLSFIVSPIDRKIITIIDNDTKDYVHITKFTEYDIIDKVRSNTLGTKYITKMYFKRNGINYNKVYKKDDIVTDFFRNNKTRNKSKEISRRNSYYIKGDK